MSDDDVKLDLALEAERARLHREALTKALEAAEQRATAAMLQTLGIDASMAPRVTHSGVAQRVHYDDMLAREIARCVVGDDDSEAP